MLSFLDCHCNGHGVDAGEFAVEFLDRVGTDGGSEAREESMRQLIRFEAVSCEVFEAFEI